MNKIVTYFALAAAAVVASVQQVQAQLVEATPTPFVIAASTATNLAVGSISIDCSAQQNVAVSWTFNITGAGTEVHGIRFVGIAEPGVRPTVPTLADGFVMVSAATGTTPVVVHTNFNVKGFSRLDCLAITNGTALLATNSIKYWVKRQAP